jgi:hypothetical protein
MIFYLISVVIITIIIFLLYKKNNKAKFENIIYIKGHEAGFFSNMFLVLGALINYDENNYSGIIIDFDKGLYYDKNRGTNWFEYYFEPIKIKNNCYNCDYIDNNIRYVDISEYNTREKNNYIINKYLRLKYYVKDIINNFKEKNFKNYFIIGIHYRGTDKIQEAPILPYEEYLNKIKEKTNKIDNYKIFIASDDINFFNFMFKHFSDKIVYYNIPNTKDNKPMHLNSDDPFNTGLTAIVDAYLLAHTNYLIRSSSNLSLFSTFVNKNLEVYEMTKRY